MSKRAVRDWVRWSIKNSLLPATNPLPYQASDGVLLSYGFNPTNMSVFGYRPTKTIVVETNGAIIIEVPEQENSQRTMQGAYGQRERELVFGVSTIWIADFTGQPQANPVVPPAFTSEEVAAEYFEQLVEGLEACLLKSIYKVTDVDGTLMAANWPLTDPVTGKASIIKGQEPRIHTFFAQPETPENQHDIIYKSYTEVRYLELMRTVDL